MQKIKEALGRLFARGSTVHPSKQGSLEYRKNKDAIKKGEIPEKYTRLLNYITGDRILELGAAEGVLSLLLAERKHQVYALELRPERHEEAKRLQQLWLHQGRDVSTCEMVLGDIRQKRDLLSKVDTLVAVRSIYYLRDQVDDVFAEVGKHVKRVVLCGNKNRAKTYFDAGGNPTDNLGRFKFYASVEGMTEVLKNAGYTIAETIRDGDPIVVGVKEIS
jgi:hypothetical protein